MRKVSRANTYFLIVMLLQLFLPVGFIFKWFNIADIKLMLFINHTIIFIVPAIIYLIVTKQSAKKVLKLNRLYFKDAMLLILLAFICQPIMAFFSLISQFFFENEIGNFMVEIVNSPYIILLLLVAVLPAITEEITIRGVILSGYEDKNIYLACMITGLLFGIMHLDPQQFLYATVLGFILAFVVRITNTIFAASLMHFFINGTSITLQKILSLVPQASTTVEEATEISLKSMPIMDKIFIIGFWGGLALIFGIIAYNVIKKIVQLNIRRGTIDKSDISISSNKDKNGEKVFNGAFIAIIVIYLLFMLRGVIVEFIVTKIIQL